MSNDVAANLAAVKQRVNDAALRSGRCPDDVELMVVSKTWSAERVGEVVAAGHRTFGENRVQEAEEKIPLLPDNLHWHLIGHLQRNKVRKALPLFQAIHSIDSLKLARYTSNIAAELGKNPDVYLSLVGLMCIPPVSARPEDARPWFVQLRELRDELETRSGARLPGLSMGMSGDYEVAIEEGSTIVRVGSAVFGSRTYV